MFGFHSLQKKLQPENRRGRRKKRHLEVSSQDCLVGGRMKVMRKRKKIRRVNSDTLFLTSDFCNALEVMGDLFLHNIA